MVAFFNHLTLARKLRLAIGLVAGLMGTLGLWQALSMRRSHEEVLALFDHRLLPMRRLKQVSDAYQVDILHAARQVRSGTMTPTEGRARLRQARAAAREAWEAFRKEALNPAEQGVLIQAQEKLDRSQALLDRLGTLLQAEDPATLGRFLDTELLPMLGWLEEDLSELARFQESVAREEVASASKRVAGAERFAALVILGGFLMALLAGRKLTQDFAGALEAVTLHMRKVANGDLKESLPIRSQDEMGALAEELNRMTERLRETLDTLRTREATQRSLLDSARALIYTADRDGKILTFNPMAEEMLGRRAKEVIGYDSLSDFHDPVELALRTLDANQAQNLNLEPGVETLVHGPRLGKVDQREWTFVRRNGTTFTGLMVLGPILAEGGMLLGFSAIVTDITAQKEADAFHRRLRAVLDLTPDAVALAELPVDHLGIPKGDPRVVFANKAFAASNAHLATKGLDPQDLLCHLPDWAVAQWREEGLPQLISLGSWRGEAALLGPLGLSVPVDLLLLAHRDDEGRTTHVSLIARDIRREKSRERLLRERETRLQAINRASPVGIFITDTDGAISYVNPSFLTITGTVKDALATRDWMEAIHPEDVDVIRSAWWFLVEQRVPFESEGRFLRPDGSIAWARIQAAAVWDEERFMGYVGCLIDTTELHAAQAELRTSEARAVAASHAKSQFLSSMSHELRTPLNAVLGYAQVMSRTEQRSEMDLEHLARIHTAGEHLLGLINDVLSLSRIEAGGMTLQPVPFDSAKLFQTLRDLHGLKTHAKGLEFRVEVTPDFPPRVEGDEGKLRQVLVNLLGNAIKFTDIGQVSLRVGYQGGRGRFEVTDTGPGIPESVQARLFENFYQTPENTRASEGTGLGLALSRAMVRLMGGEIALESTWGQGSRFFFDLPLPATEARADDTPAMRVLGVAPGQRAFRMLVADDRFENRDLLCQLLKAVGLSSDSVADGEEAVAAWASIRPDLVWMDLRMPNMDGFAALRAIRAQELEQGWPRTPVVAITASVLDLDRASLLARGFDDYLPKPFREDSLFEVLERVLGVRFTRETLAERGGDSLDGLAELEEDWKREFREAVESGDIESALTLASTLPPGPLVNGLKAHLKAYRLEELLAAL